MSKALQPKPKTKPAAKGRPSSQAEAARVQAIFDRFAAAVDHPKTELNYTDPFTLVVAVALSAQATDVSVNKATATLFRDAGAPEAMAALGVEGLEPYIKTIGALPHQGQRT